MMRLRDYLQFDKGNRVLFQSKDQLCTLENLINEQKGYANFLKSLRFKKVALQMESPTLLAKWLIMLDGMVQSIIILPDHVDTKIIEHFVDAVNIDVCLTDKDTHDALKSISHNVHTIEHSDSASEEKADLVDTDWILATSGTTGKPKLVRHTLQSLTNTTKISDKATDHYIWGLLYGLDRFAGMQVFLQALLGKSTIVMGDDDLDKTLGTFVSQGVNCLSATPTLWRKILMSPKAKLLNLNYITLGGEIADDSILRALSKQFPKTKIRHIYASTEAGVGFSVSDGKAGFPRAYLDGRLANVELKISDHQTLLIKSQSQSCGYIGSDALDIDDGYIDTGDIIRLENDRCYFEGRASGLINVGGNKVQPEYVERILLECSGVTGALVTGKKNPIMGNLIQADIVVNEMTKSEYNSEQELIADIRQYCSAKLEKFMVPAFIKIVDDLKLSSTGKVVRS